MSTLQLIAAFLLALLTIGTGVEAADIPIFGPEKYEVKERYGRPNKYSIPVSAKEGLYLVKLQNGDSSSAGSDYISLTVNGEPAVQDDRYVFTYLACFVRLGAENVIELLLKDERPSGMRRPPVVPKSVTITIAPAPRDMAFLAGSFGLSKWENLKGVAETFKNIRQPKAVALAMRSASQHLDAAARAEAVRQLSDLKDPSTEEYLLKVYGSAVDPNEVRAEAAFAVAVLGKTDHIPLLLKGLVDPDDRIRLACARGLSLYPEVKTGSGLKQVLMRLDKMRRRSTIDSIVAAGWKPFDTMRDMADSDDPVVIAIALDVIGNIREPRATELLLSIFSKQDSRNISAVIIALGSTGDMRATEALLAMAADAERRKGKEVELADALAKLGDQRAAPLIGAMIKNAQLVPIENRLRSAYRKLTGKNY